MSAEGRFQQRQEVLGTRPLARGGYLGQRLGRLADALTVGLDRLLYLLFAGSARDQNLSLEQALLGMGQGQAGAGFGVRGKRHLQGLYGAVDAVKRVAWRGAVGSVGEARCADQEDEREQDCCDGPAEPGAPGEKGNDPSPES